MKTSDSTATTAIDDDHVRAAARSALQPRRGASARTASTTTATATRVPSPTSSSELVSM